MMNDNTSANSTSVPNASDSSPSQPSPSQPSPDGDQNTSINSIISTTVVAGVLLVAFIISYVLYRKLFRSHKTRYGDEEHATKKIDRNSKKAEFIDQFNVNEHQNSVTSSIGLVTSHTKPLLTTSPFEAADADTEAKMINSGKRVFSVSRVSEEPQPLGNQILLRVPKGFADVYRSLQVNDSKQYMLAVIDQRSKTIHNIDARRYHLAQKVHSSVNGQVLVLTPKTRCSLKERKRSLDSSSLKGSRGSARGVQAQTLKGNQASRFSRRTVDSPSTSCHHCDQVDNRRRSSSTSDSSRRWSFGDDEPHIKHTGTVIPSIQIETVLDGNDTVSQPR